MAEKETSARIPTNEEVIEELTKDLDSQCSTHEENTTSVPPAENNSEIDSEAEQDDEEQKKRVPDDFIDDKALKELESTLTKEELDRRKAQAAGYKTKGNEAFKKGDYLEASRVYTDALRLCPLSCVEERSVFFCNRAAAKMQLKRPKCALEDCTKAVELNDKYVRAYLRRAKLYEELDKLDESLQDYQKVIELDPSNHEARSAAVRLPPIINERNEKMKTEVLGKFDLIPINNIYGQQVNRLCFHQYYAHLQLFCILNESLYYFYFAH